MSIVVVVRKDKRIAMAADTMSACGSHRDAPDNVETRKIRRLGSAVMGTTGWALMDNVLEDMLAAKRPPRLNSKGAIFKFYLKLWRELHERYTLVNDQSEDKSTPYGDIDGQFLVAHRNGIYAVASNLTVCELKKYYAIGGGSDYAFGALYNLYDSELDAREVAIQAVRTAINFDLYCGGSIDVLEVPCAPAKRRGAKR